MVELLVILALLAVLLVAFGASSRSKQRRELERREAELAPVRKLVFEDITALGVELQDLDADLAGQPLDPGANADYQRALDAYEAAKEAGDRVAHADEVKNVTSILDDGRYAIVCVRARVAGEPLPTRRPPCFFDPRHGLSVADVPWTPAGGARRDVPACALDAERVRLGAEPDIRQVMVGSRRVPYWQGGRAYQPYAAGYYGGFAMMDFMFMGMMFGAFGGFDAIGELGEGLGEGLGSIGEGLGDMFDGFDF
ncbi:hypothetical protein [Nocardioides sp. SYSU DS0663]|uniref:hypothetical protein n=1 Tax=Nocardioides sp. SYSU DS0663 TaxID=3416445 RepID=UPI003F4C0EC9